MNNLAKKWVKALKSGKYKQTKDRLGSAKEGYCCLGVLQCVYRKDNPSFRGNGSTYAMPPAKLLRLAGISFNLAAELADINDEKCNGNFIPVIEYIEENKNLFISTKDLKDEYYPAS